MTAPAAQRSHLLLPWTVQEREDPVLEFDRGEGVYFFDRQGRRYLDMLSQLFHCNLGDGNRGVIEAIQRQASRASCISPQVLTPALTRRKDRRAEPAAEKARAAGADIPAPAASMVTRVWRRESFVIHVSLGCGLRRLKARATQAFVTIYTNRLYLAIYVPVYIK